MPPQKLPLDPTSSFVEDDLFLPPWVSDSDEDDSDSDDSMLSNSSSLPVLNSVESILQYNATLLAAYGNFSDLVSDEVVPGGVDDPSSDPLQVDIPSTDIPSGNVTEIPVNSTPVNRVDPVSDSVISDHRYVSTSAPGDDEMDHDCAVSPSSSVCDHVRPVSVDPRELVETVYGGVDHAVGSSDVRTTSPMTLTSADLIQTLITQAINSVYGNTTTPTPVVDPVDPPDGSHELVIPVKVEVEMSDSSSEPPPSDSQLFLPSYDFDDEDVDPVKSEVKPLDVMFSSALNDSAVFNLTHSDPGSFNTTLVGTADDDSHLDMEFSYFEVRLLPC